MRGINVRNSLTDEWKDRGAKEGGKIAGNTRNEIEEKTVKKVMDKNNYLGNKKQKAIVMPT